MPASTCSPWRPSASFTCRSNGSASASLSQELAAAPPTPWGQIRLPVTFGTRDNYRTELVDFAIARVGLPYNAILGYPALAQFMVATHHGYIVLKIPGSGGIITVHYEERDAVCSLERAFQAAAIEDPNKNGAQYPPEVVPKKKKQLLRTGPQGSGVSGGATSGSAPAPGAPPSLA